MSMFIYVSLCFAIILAAPVLSLDSKKRSECTENGECFERKLQENPEKNCNCDHNNDNNSLPLMYYNELTDEFGNKIGNISILNIKHLLQTLTEKHNTEEKIRKEVEVVFRGVLVAVILFVVCASVCLLTACIYCCRISIIDNQLKNDVEALAEKLKRECRFKKSMKKSPRQPVSESCNIIVEDAGVFVV